MPYKKHRKSRSNKKTRPSVEKSRKNKTTIHDLDNNCLVKIFQFLPIIDKVRIERVCRRWQTASKESWQHVKKINGNENLWGFRMKKKSACRRDRMALKEVLQRCGCYITHIDFTSLRFNKTILCLVSEMCSNLESIEFDYENLDPYNSHFLSDRYLAELFKKNQNLKHFKLYNSFRVKGTCLLHLSKECIQTIFMSAQECARNDFSETIFDIIKPFQNLETLVLRHKLFFWPREILKPQSVTLPNSIKYLDIERGLFGLCDLNSITEMSNLEKMNIAGADVTDEFLFRLTMNCQNLEMIVMNDCQGITDAGVKAVAKLPCIKVLSIANTKISDQAVKNMRMLTELDCSKCDNMKDDGICKLLASNDSILDLNLSQCYQITNRVLQSAISNCEQRDVALQINLSLTEVNLTEQTINMSLPLNLSVILNNSDSNFLHQIYHSIFGKDNDSDEETGDNNDDETDDDNDDETNDDSDDETDDDSYGIEEFINYSILLGCHPQG